eukprot:TRINITY_DN2198_c0_g2_i1.p1 TRINITY_DN2198_c0_g2~~TRINITY_DN2198_c0_g2_i1.p1  ORF type:complete len:206 (-),score=37.11 TRINITY_DN2198_c0_g2_i1:270-887(-)
MFSIQGSSLQVKNIKFSNQISNRLIKFQQKPKSKKVFAQAENENGGEFVSGEWPVNWSLVSMEDCNSYYIDKKLKTQLEPHYKLTDVMDTQVVTAQEKQTISEFEKTVKEVGCVPVTTGMGVLQGVIYESDLKKSGDTAFSIMQQPIAGRGDFSVEEAACIMLKYQISNLPVVNERAVLIGMVNNTEIFQAIEIETGVEAKAAEI